MIDSAYLKKSLAALLSLIVLLTQANTAFAQAQITIDIQAPVIEMEALQDSPADDTQVFAAQVADDRALKDVILYYRRAGQSPFQNTSMNELNASGYYSASIDTDPQDLRPIEYYVQARDESGNRTVKGFAFDPFIRNIYKDTGAAAATQPQPAVAEPAEGVAPVVIAAPTNNTSQSSGSPIKWWQIALGVVAVGALAAAAGGSGGSDSGSTSGTNTLVPLTIQITEPQ